MKRTIATKDGGIDIPLTPSEISEHQARDAEYAANLAQRHAQREINAAEQALVTPAVIESIISALELNGITLPEKAGAAIMRVRDARK